MTTLYKVLRRDSNTGKLLSYSAFSVLDYEPGLMINTSKYKMLCLEKVADAVKLIQSHPFSTILEIWECETVDTPQPMSRLLFWSRMYRDDMVLFWGNPEWFINSFSHRTMEAPDGTLAVSTLTITKRLAVRDRKGIFHWESEAA